VATTTTNLTEWRDITKWDGHWSSVLLCGSRDLYRVRILVSSHKYRRRPPFTLHADWNQGASPKL